MSFAPRPRAALALAAALPLLCACGRAGPLEAPPTAQALQRQTDPGAAPLRRPDPGIARPEGPFVLDPLVK